jgi:hypothetical protein
MWHLPVVAGGGVNDGPRKEVVHQVSRVWCV